MTSTSRFRALVRRYASHRRRIAEMRRLQVAEALRQLAQMKRVAA